MSAVNLAADLVLVTELTAITVRATGPRSAVEDLNATDIIATIDFGDIIETDSYTMRINVDEPDEIWSTSASPDSVNVVIERQAAKSLPVTAQLSGAPVSNQQVGQITPNASEVTVSGPASLVERVTRVELPVDISNRTVNFSGEFEPIPVDAAGQVIAGVTLNPNAITATVEITARGKRVAVIAQINGEPAPGFEVVDRLINPDTVLVDGSPEVLESLITLTTDAIDITDAEDDVTIRVSISELPDGVTLLEPESGLVDVVVQIRQRGQQQPLPSQQVTVVNLGSGLDATVEPNSVLITVVGNEQELESLSASSLIVQVDADGLGPGVHELLPTVVLPPRMEWTGIEPRRVTLTITRSDEPIATPLGGPAP